MRKNSMNGEDDSNILKQIQDLQEVYDKCESICEKYKYIDNFSINDLSDSTGIPVHSISEVTNGQMEQNFFDYTNNYRVEEFKHLAVDPNHKNVKILHLAFEAGFSSKTSFNQAFKKFTGDTPSNFIKGINS